MKSSYVLKTFAIFCCSFLLVWAIFLATHLWQSDKEIQETPKISFSQNPKMMIQNYNSAITHVTRVEIAIKDDISIPNGKISKVKFNNDVLHLHPANPKGNRGSTHLQLKPGIYTIKWRTKNNKYTNSKYAKYTEVLKITEADLWKHILIEGNKIKIN